MIVNLVNLKDGKGSEIVAHRSEYGGARREEGNGFFG